MIRFFFVDLFEYGTLASRYRYWMRLDTDAVLTQPVADPFSRLDQDPHVGYLHNEEMVDCGDVARGLPAFADTWARAHKQSWHGRARALAAGRQQLQPEELVERSGEPPDCVMGYYNK